MLRWTHVTDSWRRLADRRCRRPGTSDTGTHSSQWDILKPGAEETLDRQSRRWRASSCRATSEEQSASAGHHALAVTDDVHTSDWVPVIRRAAVQSHTSTDVSLTDGDGVEMWRDWPSDGRTTSRWDRHTSTDSLSVYEHQTRRYVIADRRLSACQQCSSPASRAAVRTHTHTHTRN